MPGELRENYIRQLRRANSALRYLRDPRALAQRVNEQLAREGWVEDLIERRFDTEGASAGQPWRGLAKSTARQRARLGFPADHPILQRSGLLKAAATKGRRIVTPDRIVKQFRDGAAPRYVGGGSHRKKSRNLSVAGANAFWGGLRFGASNSLSDYAPRLNRVRPFYQPASREELAPMFARRDQLITQVIARISDGASLRGLI
ncbi:MAG: hypothetical protein KIS92_00855 [Planctomycetota bacterium]|nr:hypothetical protein [Planctomycetota bacterium]